MEFKIELDEALTKDLMDAITGSRIPYWDENGNLGFRFEKRLVSKINGLKVEVFSNEHPPPHFRIIYQGKTANFTISKCEFMNGDRSVLKHQKSIKAWWKMNKQKIIDAWDEGRPSDCPVGRYKS